ncbi:hypothetical protein BIY23_03510 [Wolbachia pipientis]|uniref:Uncharacterized protein n=1 Tax=Wolbachia pipientis TaxID=955 RepID=A0A1E7QJ39_WOLPI|nr:GH25 family lysozyme [Wolbachia pipientis]OEY86475.1 hypothetical protein BIY23_03510 [Wolbachia pipientis]
MKRGITTSHHDEGGYNVNTKTCDKGTHIDIDKVRHKVEQGEIDYWFTKITEGQSWQDTKFREIFPKIKAINGIEAGVFHVFRMTSTPEEQFQNITSQLSLIDFKPDVDKLIICTTTVSIEKDKKPNGQEYTQQERSDSLRSLLGQLKLSGYNLVLHVLKTEEWNMYYTHDADLAQYPLCLPYIDKMALQIPHGWEKCDYWNMDKQSVINRPLTEMKWPVLEHVYNYVHNQCSIQ